MNIKKIDNGFTVEYQTDKPEDKSNWDSAYEYHTYAFSTWTDLVDFISKSERLVD